MALPGDLCRGRPDRTEYCILLGYNLHSGYQDASNRNSNQVPSDPSTRTKTTALCGINMISHRTMGHRQSRTRVTLMPISYHNHSSFVQALTTYDKDIHFIKSPDTFRNRLDRYKLVISLSRIGDLHILSEGPISSSWVPVLDYYMLKQRSPLTNHCMLILKCWVSKW